MATSALFWRGAPAVLASTSVTRLRALQAVGLVLEVEAPQVDERAVEAAFLAGGGEPRNLAGELARAKAFDVSERRPGALVLGFDQTLTLGDRAFHKATNLAEAAVHLRALAGRVHRLTSAFAAARDGAILGQGVDVADLTMRNLGPAAVAAYLAAVGDDALGSVGGYRIEGAGIHLFERLSGDHFTILGLPLFALLKFLRDQERLIL